MSYKTNTFCGVEHWLDVFHSDIAEHPNDFTQWEIIPFVRNYRNARSIVDFFSSRKVDGRREIFPTCPGLRMKLQHNLAFLLSLYSHSGEAWSFMGGGTQCAFDTTRFAGIMIYRGKAKDIPADKREEQAANVLELYNGYVNGEVYEVRSCWYDSRNYACSEIMADDEVSGEHYGYIHLIDILEKGAPYHRVTKSTIELLGRDTLRDLLQPPATGREIQIQDDADLRDKMWEAL